MRTSRERLENVLRWWSIRPYLLTLPHLAPLFCDFPQSVHVFPRDHLIPVTAKHEDGERCGDARELRSRIPFLVTEKREDSDDRPVSDYAGKRSESVLDYKRAYLRIQV